METTRRSQFVRMRQTEMALVLMGIGAAVYVWALWDHTNASTLTSWAFAVVALTALRSLTSKRIENNLATADAETLVRNETDLVFTGVSIPLVIGCGYWLFCSEGDTLVVLAVTLISCMYAVGSAVNTVAQRRMQFLMVSLNLGQGILYFVSRGSGDYYPAALQLIALSFLLLGFAKRLHEMFVELVKSELEIKEQNARLMQSRVEIEAALEEAVGANKAKSHFLAAASHDLSQPLHAMSLFISSMKKRVAGDESLSELTGKIEGTSEILKQQFEGLLELSRYDAGGVVAQLKTFDLYAFCEVIVQNDKLLANRAGINLKISGQSVSVYTDPVLLGRLVDNIVTNAIKFTEQGSVELKLIEMDGQVELRIIDTGRGISELDRERIFEDFVQLNNPGRNHKFGAGLGLSIVRSISELLGLNVQVSSTPGVGSEFSVTIPRDMAHNMPWNMTETNNRTLGSQSDTPCYANYPDDIHGASPVDLTGLQILVVDDDVNILDALRQYIHDRGGKALTASTPEEGLDLSRTCEANFAIIDDMLDKSITGLELATILSANINEDRIIIVTGNNEPVRLGWLRSTAFGIYLKPLTGTTMDDVMRQRIEMHALRESA